MCFPRTSKTFPKKNVWSISLENAAEIRIWGDSIICSSKTLLGSRHWSREWLQTHLAAGHTRNIFQLKQLEAHFTIQPRFYAVPFWTCALNGSDSEIGMALYRNTAKILVRMPLFFLTRHGKCKRSSPQHF